MAVGTASTLNVELSTFTVEAEAELYLHQLHEERAADDLRLRKHV